MSDKLIWQSKENPTIEVVYDSIYGMPIEKCMEILHNYRQGKYIPVEWLKEKYSWLTMAGEIIKDWESENEH